jgi:hypothetical protein
MNNELEGDVEGTGCTLFHVLPQLYPGRGGGYDENHDKPHSGQKAFRPRPEQSTWE